MQNFGVTNKEHYDMLRYFLQWSINVIQCTCNLRDLKRLYSQTRVILFCWLLKINPFLFILKNSTMSHKSTEFMLGGAASLSSQSVGLKFKLTASWICSRQNKFQLLIHTCKQVANCFVSGQLGFLTVLFLFQYLFSVLSCGSHRKLPGQA